MRTSFETEERQQADTEITLGTATLLSIFFGLVVVCGVFFGFGYSVGRRAPSQPLSSAAVANEASEPTTDVHGTKPSAHQAALTTVTPAEDPATLPAVQKQNSTAQDSRTVTVAEAPDAEAPERTTPLQRVTASASPATEPAATRGTNFMVQIAAVSHQEDAEVLVGALRKRGYNVSIHSESQDKLLHVQVGPFDYKAEAIAMKQKLLADGYNAIVK